MNKISKIPIILKETEGIFRQNEPIAIGVPFAEGTLKSEEELCLTGSEGVMIPVQFAPLVRWSDGSIKWLLTQFLASVPADGEQTYFVQGGKRAETQSPVTIKDEDNQLLIDTPKCRLAFDKNLPGGLSLFKFYDREFRPVDSLAEGEANGLSLHQSPPESMEISERGIIRVVVRLKGRFINTGDLDLRYTTLFYLYPDRQELRWTQIFHFYGGAQRMSLERLSTVLQAPNGTQFDWEGKLISLSPEGEFQLRQKSDLSYEWTATNTAGGQGQRAEGEFLWQSAHGASGFAVRDFWEKSPAAFTFRGDGRLQFDFPPPNPEEPLTLTSGTSFRREISLAFGLNPAGVRQELESFTKPLSWSIDPGYFCETRALGHLSPEDSSKCPGFENGIREGLEKLLAQRQQNVNYFGLLNYGDWPMKEGAYGSTWTMYADNEYDAPHVLFMLFARSGRWEYFQVGRAGAIHMADVDTHCETGGMFFHGYSGNAENHQAYRGSPGEWGHVWADGMLDYYYLTGDVTTLESAKMLGDFCLRGFAGEGHQPVRRIFAGCERAVGWPMITLASLAEATGEQIYLDKAQQMVDYLKHYVDDPDGEMEISPGGPQSGHWWRILMQDGCKPFMVGVLYEGLKRYHQLTKDEKCVEVFQKSLDWLIDKMWYPLRGAFEYEFNAFNEGHRYSFPHYINLLVVDGLAYAYRLTGKRRYLEVGVQAFYSALWTLPGLLGGKEIGMGGRSSLDFMALLSEMQNSEAHAPSGILALSADDSDGFKPTVVENLAWPKREAGEIKMLLNVPFDEKPEPQKAGNPKIIVEGTPQITKDGLHAVRGSVVTFEASGNVSEIAGTCRFRFHPDWPGDSKGRPYPRTLIHIQGKQFTRDAISLIVFYNGMHLRVYGPDRKLSGVIETDVTAWTPGEWHDIAFTWQVEPRYNRDEIPRIGDGCAQLFIDEELKGEITLRCPFSSPFSLIRVGHRPGFWFADGWLRDLQIFDGVI